MTKVNNAGMRRWEPNEGKLATRRAGTETFLELDDP